MPNRSSRILPWGDVIEDFLDGIGLDLEHFLDEMTGGWLFGYVESLERAGVRSLIVCTSSTATEVTERRHAPTGATVWLLPAGRALRRTRRGGRGPRRPGCRTVARRPTRSSLASVLRRERVDRGAVPGVHRGALLDLRRGRHGRSASRRSPPSRAARNRRPPLERWTREPDAAGGGGVRRRLEPGKPSGCTPRWGIPERPHPPRPEPAVARRVAGRRPGRRPRRPRRPRTTSAVVAWYGRVEVHRKGVDVLLDAWDLVAARPAPTTSSSWATVRTPQRCTSGSTAGPTSAGCTRTCSTARLIHQNLAAADVAVLPSRHEGFPVALLEMMASGRAVVAADVPGVRDVAPGGEADGCIVVPTGDVAALHARDRGAPRRRCPGGRRWSTRRAGGSRRPSPTRPSDVASRRS